MDLNDLPDEALDQLLSLTETLSVKSPLDYIPHEKQRKFHCSLKRIRLISGGNQSGKTVAGANESLFHATGLYPDWYPKEMRLTRANRGRIVGEDYAKWGAVVEEKLFEWLPRDLVVHVRRTMKGAIERVQIKHVSGGISSFDVLTHEQDDGVFESWTGDWAWFDEPPPEEKWIATKRGLMAQSGRAWFTMTPVKEPWIYNEFMLDVNEYVESINVDIRENPHLKEQDILFFEKGLTDDVKEARLHGVFKHLSGRVYKEFDKDIHVVSMNNSISYVPQDKSTIQHTNIHNTNTVSIKLDRNWPVYFVADPHPRKPHKAIWARVDPFGRIYVFDEIVYQGTLKDFSKEVLKREIMNKINPNEVVRIGDPNMMNTPSPMNGLTFKQEFSSHGLHFITNVNDDLNIGHLAVQGRLMFDRSKPVSSTNCPRLYFSQEGCPGVIKEMLMYVWDEWKGNSRDSKGLKEVPKDINKCFPDCVRYLVVFNPTFYVANEPDPGHEDNHGVTGYRR